MRVLVCGGRDYGNRDFVFYTLNRIKPTLVIQGGATGADYLAKLWCEVNNITCQEFKADWKTFGKAAGPIRNAKMLSEGKPDLVVAFPGGRGTADMIKQASKANTQVLILKEPTVPYIIINLYTINKNNGTIKGL